MLSTSKVLAALSDEKAANLFKTIASSKINSIKTSILSSKFNITRKQYYSRMESLTKAGLVRRKNGRYFLTTFGEIIYNYQIYIETAVSQYSKLKALDSILLSLSSDNIKIPLEEQISFVDKIIDNDNIKEIIISSLNNAIGFHTVHHPNQKETTSVAITGTNFHPYPINSNGNIDS
jgi:predicted transcriptional regulator